MLKINIEQKTRRCRCHTPGCRNRNALKVSRRYDVNGNPLFLCPDCIKEIYAAYTEMSSGGSVESAESAEKVVEAVEEIQPKKKNSKRGGE